MKSVCNVPSYPKVLCQIRDKSIFTLSVCYYSWTKETVIISNWSDSSFSDQISLSVAISCSAIVIFIASWWQAYWEVWRVMIKYQFCFKTQHGHIILFSIKYFLRHLRLTYNLIILLFSTYEIFLGHLRLG